MHILAWDHLACLRSARKDEPLVTAERYKRLIGADEWTSEVIREIEAAKSQFFAEFDGRADMMSPDTYSSLVYGRLMEAILGDSAWTTEEDLVTVLQRKTAMLLLQRGSHQYWFALTSGEVPANATSTTYMDSWLAFEPNLAEEG